MTIATCIINLKNANSAIFLNIWIEYENEVELIILIEHAPNEYR